MDKHLTKIDHDVDEFQIGHDYELVLQDQSVLDFEEPEILENVNLQSDFQVKVKKQKLIQQK